MQSRHLLRTFLGAALLSLLSMVNLFAGEASSVVLNVGLYDNPPKVFPDEAGRAAGIFPELLNDIASRHGWKLIWKHSTWASCLDMLEKGDIDLMVDVAPTVARRERFLFGTESVLMNCGVLYERDTSHTGTIEDLRGKRIAVMWESVHYAEEGGITSFLKEFGIDATFAEVDAYGDVFRMVESGQADYGVVNRIYGDRFASQFNLQPTLLAFNPQSLHFAVRRNNPAMQEVLNVLDADLRAQKADPDSTYSTIIQDYLQSGRSARTILRMPSWVVWAGGGAIALLLALCIVIAMLWKKSHQRAKQIVEKTEELERYFSSSLDLLCIADTDGHFLRLNPEWERTLGYPLEELLHMKFFDLVHPDDIGPTMKTVQALMSQEEVRNFTNRYRTRDGSYKWIEWRSIPWGNLIYAVARDMTAHTEAEIALRESENRVRSIFRAAPVGIGIVVDRVIVEANERFSEITGLAASEIRGLNTRTLYPDQDAFERAGKSLYAGISGGGIGETEAVWQHRNGDLRSVLLRVIAVDPEDTAKGFFFTVLDITERKRAELALRESENRMRSIVRAAPVGIGLVINRVTVEGNERLAEITGYSLAELRNQPARILYQDEGEYTRVGRELYRPDASPGTGMAETTWVRKNGDLIDVLIHSAQIVPGEPQAGITCTVLDITKRKLAEQRLRDSEENLRITLDSIGDAVIATDAEGRITRMNPVAEQLTSWPYADATGHPLHEVFHIIHATSRRDCENPAEKVIQSGKIVGLANHTVLVSRDGTERQIADSGAPIRDQAGAIVGVVLVFRDVTEQYRIEEQLRQSQKMDSIGQLAGGVAHDFNNMLGGIMGGAELLEKLLADNAQARRIVSMILAAAERAASLTQKLLAFSRKARVQSIPVDIRTILTETAHLLERSIDKRITLRMELAEEPATVIGDPSQLENAFINICLNARDAMPEGGDIILRTKLVELDEAFCRDSGFSAQPGKAVKVSIADTGTGMDHATKEHIFEPFFTTKETGKGTGLGLSAVYGTVKEHHGIINVETALGRGTIFTVYLPITVGESEPDVPAPQLAPVTGKCILVVDDETVIRTVACSMLEDLGYRVLAAENGKKGVETFIQYQDVIDLVVMDMVMPVMNGREAFLSIKAIQPQVRVLFSSGFARDASLADLTQDPCCAGFIQKPFRRDELLRLLASIFSA